MTRHGARRKTRTRLGWSLAAAGLTLAGSGGVKADQKAVVKTAAPAALSSAKTLYVVGYAHLDTQWCWAYPQVIREFLPKTLRDNFALFEKYPHYTFNFTGSSRYRLMKEYYPDDYARLKRYVAAGRWVPTGSSVDEGDVVITGPESIIRQVLYGNQFFQREFGKPSQDFMLPDSFGFPASLPSLLAHCGLKGFSTQKLTWGSAVGIPFNVGVWQGPDGRSVLAALNPGSYTGTVREDLSQSTSWAQRLDQDAQRSGLAVDYHYFGTGDRGGAPGEDSVRWVEQSVTGDGPTRVIAGRADQMFRDLTPAQAAALPRYKGDLLLTQHSAGSLTSEAMMKHWNRRNEVLADDAERASVMADWLGAAPYPRARLSDAWQRFLMTEMHDMLPGTAFPTAYRFAWNNEVLALNQFAGVLSAGVGGVARALDTQHVQGVPLVVYNPLSVDRQDVVEARVPFANGAPRSVRVFGPDGKEVPAQVSGRDGDALHILFLAHAPSVGTAVYDVRPATGPAALPSPLRVTDHSLENARYRVRLNAAGDVASIYDKTASKELLSGPARLAFQHENPSQYPAWNMDWQDQQKPPQAYVDGPARVQVIENGPARVALQVTRCAQGSRFVQTIRLAAGQAGDRVEFADSIDWKSRASSLKATFPLTVSNPEATYSWGVGTVRRGTNDPRKYEVPAHQWFDLTDTHGRYGVSVLSNDKYGSDKPDDRTLRLTLLYSPGIRGGYQHQATQDWGHHEIVYALAGHPGDWRRGNSVWEAARLNQPLVAFQAPPHPGALGRTFSLLHVSNPRVTVQALKKAEGSDEVIVRLNELGGQSPQDVRLALAAPIVAAREVNGQEQPLGGAVVRNGQLVVRMEPYRLRAFALKLGRPPVRLSAPQSVPVSLPAGPRVASTVSGQGSGFDGQGRALPAPLLPAHIDADGIGFRLGAHPDALVCQGQSLRLPAGHARRVYLLAASAGGDTPGTFQVAGRPTTLTVQDWSGEIGQWDTRLWKGKVAELTYDWPYPLAGLVPGTIKRAPVAWYADHRVLADGQNDPYQFCYLFRYSLPLPDGVRTLTLPRNPKIRILAVSVAQDPNDDLVPVQPLYDTLHTQNSVGPSVSPAGGRFRDAVQVSLQQPLYFRPGDTLHYTLDGRDPGPASPVYTGPLTLSRPATLKVRSFSGRGGSSPVRVARFQVTDITPPSVRSVLGLDHAAQVQVAFSEAVTRESAEAPSHYRLQPAAAITRAALAPDGRTVTLSLDAPLSWDTAYTLSVAGVRDLSPAGNAVRPDQPLAVSNLRPVFQSPAVQTFSGQSEGVTQDAVPGLPTRAGAPWTINQFVFLDRQPEELTVLGGFGSGADVSGTQRYLIKFHDGIHFWGSNVDINAGVPFDIGRWQMITLTFDGRRLTLYKNGQAVKTGDITLADADAVVKIAAPGPWDGAPHLAGRIGGFTIWDRALPAAFVRALQTTGPPS